MIILGSVFLMLTKSVLSISLIRKWWPKILTISICWKAESLAFSSQKGNVQSEDVWHSRLGHAKNCIKPRVQILCSSICALFHMAKSNKIQFFSSDSRVEKPLKRVNRDVWNPSPVVSNQEFKYYAIFVDEHYRWFYLIKLKSEFYYIFIMFQQLFENQLGTKIKYFQSDGKG